MKAILSALLLLSALGASAAERETVNFNPDWRFLKADPIGAEKPDFNDGKWQVVSAPHTFNDVDTFDDWSLPGHRGEQNQWEGRTWYRKGFLVPEAWKGKRVFIEFEAVRQVAEIYLNGVKLGTAKGGFTPFGFDLTPHLKFGQRNLIAVMADNRFMKDPPADAPPQAATNSATQPVLSQLSSAFNAQIPDSIEALQANQIPWNNPHWHPAHGGLYRNVRLIVTDPLHITLPLYSFLQTEGPYIYSSSVDEHEATVNLEVPVANGRKSHEKFTVSADIKDSDGHSVLQLSADASLPAGANRKIILTGKIANPRLWEPGYPHLYRAVLALTKGGQKIDGNEVEFGVRTERWDAASGLWVNGRHVKLHGWGQKPTNEWPGLGAALPDWLQAYTLQLMKEAGGNFIRWGHMPGSPAQIAAGDRLGLIADQPGGDGESDTVGGAWLLRMADFRDALIYFRNSPSIFLWEGGNQKVTRDHAAQVRAMMDRYDPHGGRALAFRRADAVTAEFMDVGIGTEGGREIARLPVVEGEYDREESPRRVWDDVSPPNFGYPEAKGQTYQLTSEQFAVNEVKQYVGKLGANDHAGGANWIFSDSTSGGRVGVEVARASGEVDGVRLPKEAYYVCQVMFSPVPRAHIIGHWSYPAGTHKNVYVAANGGGEVELLVNGRSLGRVSPENRYLYSFKDVAFEPGEITAIAYDKSGKETARTALRTAGPAVALKLTAITAPGGWRADGSDIALFDVEAVDAEGRRTPTTQQRVDFQLAGDGVWRGGYDSGKINSINNPWLDLEAGINRVAVRATLKPGKITLHAKSDGLKDAEISLSSLAFKGGAPDFPDYSLPKAPERDPADLAVTAGSGKALSADWAGHFTRKLLYTAPYAEIAHVEANLQRGRNAYVDKDSPFSDVPENLIGADWVQAADRDANYHAVDFMELTVAAGSRVTVAHDDRLARPAWLLKDFQPTGEHITLAGQSMSLFARQIPAEAGLTFGPNADDGVSHAANMYVIFIKE